MRTYQISISTGTEHSYWNGKIFMDINAPADLNWQTNNSDEAWETLNKINQEHNKFGYKNAKMDVFED